jgi:hypothetical protein
MRTLLNGLFEANHLATGLPKYGDVLVVAKLLRAQVTLGEGHAHHFKQFSGLM